MVLQNAVLCVCIVDSIIVSGVVASIVVEDGDVMCSVKFMLL